MFRDIKPNRSSSPPPQEADGAVPDLESAGGHQRENPSQAAPRRRCQAFYEVVGRVSGALRREPTSYWILLMISIATMVISLTAASLLTRTYMESQDSRSIPLFFWLASAGWPLTALVLVLLYALNKQAPPSQVFRSAPVKFVVWGVFLGALAAASNFMVIGMSGALGDNGELLFGSYHGSSLAITSALFGRLIAKNRFRSSVNVAVVVTIAALIGAYRTTKPFVLDEDYEPIKFIGYFLLDLPASAIRGLAFAIAERVYFSKLKEPALPRRAAGSVRASFLLVLEVALLISLSTFAFSAIGLGFVNHGIGHYFQQVTARRFSGGETAYYAVVLGSIAAFQLAAIAGAAVVCLLSATYAGVLGAVAVAAYGLLVPTFFDADTMTGFSILAFVLAIWGLLIHAYGRCRDRQEGLRG